MIRLLDSARLVDLDPSSIFTLRPPRVLRHELHEVTISCFRISRSSRLTNLQMITYSCLICFCPAAIIYSNDPINHSVNSQHVIRSHTYPAQVSGTSRTEFKAQQSIFLDGFP